MIYLIDFENVSSGGFNGIEALDAKDELMIFYSEQKSSISISVHRKLEKSPVKKEYLPIRTGGKNALDFQLVTWLGYLIAKGEKAEYCVVSNDTGFDYALDFWKKRGIRVSRSVDLNGIQLSHTKGRIQEMLPQYRQDAGKIMDTINRYKTKQGINNALVKLYGSEKAGVVYKAIRPLIANKKGK